jgi:hypothetical protein
MNTERAHILKKCLIVSIVFFTFFLLLFALDHVVAPRSEAMLRHAADEVLSQWNISAPVSGERFLIRNVGWNYTQAYVAKQKKRNVGLVFIVRITGRSGPLTGVFYRPNAGSTVFCGIAGMPDIDGARYGITPNIVNYWVRAIDRIALDQERGETKK